MIKLTDPPGFEPGSEAPEASILSRLYYESTRLLFLRPMVLAGTITIRAALQNI